MSKILEKHNMKLAVNVDRDNKVSVRCIQSITTWHDTFDIPVDALPELIKELQAMYVRAKSLQSDHQSVSETSTRKE